MTRKININAPACPDCNGILKKSHITRDYFCMNCRKFWDAIEMGTTEREMICKERKEHV